MDVKKNGTLQDISKANLQTTWAYELGKNNQLIFQGPRYVRVVSLLACGSPMIFSCFASQ